MSDDDFDVEQVVPEVDPRARPRHVAFSPDISAEVDRILAAGAVNAVHNTRRKGRGPTQAQQAFIDSQHNNTTPAAALESPKPVPESKVDGEKLVNDAPVTAKGLVTSPGFAAAVGGSDDTLEQMVRVEQAYQSKFEEAKAARALAEKKAEEPGLGLREYTDPFMSGYHQSRMDELGALIGMGSKDPSLQKEYEEAKKSRDEYSKTPTGILGETARMVPALAKQFGAGALTAAPVVGTGLLLAPETAGISAIGGVALGSLAFQTGSSLKAGFDAFGHAYNEFRETGVDDNVARGGATVVGLVNGLAFFGGEKLVASSLAPIMAKFGGGKVAGNIVERIVGKAIGNPQFRSKLAQLGAMGITSATALTAFSVLNEIVMGVTEHDISVIEKEAEGKIFPDPGPKEVFDRSIDAIKQTAAPGFILGIFTGAPLAIRGKLAERKASATAFRDNGLPAIADLSAGEAGKASETLRDILADVEQTHGDSEIHESVSVPTEQLRKMQKEKLGGKVFSSDVERIISDAEQSGAEAVFPSETYATQVLNQKGAEVLKPYERIGDSLTLEEQKKVNEAVKEGTWEKDPIEQDLKKVANDIYTKAVAAGQTKNKARVYAAITSNLVRVAAIDKARRLGVEPQVFEEYAAVPLEIVGGREKAVIDFEKATKRLVGEVAKEERRAGAPEQVEREAVAEEEAAKKGKAYKKESPLARLQEAARKTLGETFLAFRVEDTGREAVAAVPGGEAYLSAKEAQTKVGPGQTLAPVYLRPSDLTGVKGRVVTTGDLPAERFRPSGAEQAQPVEGKGALQTGDIFHLTLSGDADASTFIHESAHYVLEQMQRLVPEKLASFGIDPLKQITEAQHEKFAREMEQYFLEGEAPSKALIDQFQTVSHWMKGVYESLTVQGIHLDENAKRTFDRFFALQEEVDAIGKVQGLDESAFEAGLLSPAEMLDYRAAMDNAKQTALAQAHETAARLERKDTRDRLEDFKAQAASEVFGDKTNNLFNWLKEGETLDGRVYPRLEEGKLNYDDVKMLGFNPNEGPLKSLVGKKGESLVGFDPDVLAARMDYHDGRDMLEQLSKVESFREQARLVAEARFAEKNPGWSAMDDYIKAKGMEAAHGAALRKLRLMEMRLIGERLGFKNGHERAALEIDQTIKTILESKTKKEIQPGAAFRAEARSIAKMKEALGKGKMEEAWEFSKQAYAATQRVIQETKARDSIDKDVKDMKKLATDTSVRSLIGKADTEHNAYQIVMDHLLNGLGFDIPKPEDSLKGAMKVLFDRGESLQIPNQFYEPGGIRNYQRMPYMDAKEAFEIVRAAAHLAENRFEVVIDGKRRAVTEVADSLSKTLLEGAPWKDVETSRERINAPPTAMGTLRKMVAPLVRMQSLMRIYDANKLGGEFASKLWRPIEEADHIGEKMRVKVAQDLHEVLLGMMKATGETKDEFRQRMQTEVEVGGKKVLIHDVFDILVKWGDEGARDRLLRGFGWTYRGIKADINNLLARGLIRPEDAEGINGLSRINNAHWKELELTRQKEYGLKPKKVPAAPDVFDGPHAPFKLEGGYAPIEYDYAAEGLPVPKQEGSIFQITQHQAGMYTGMVKDRSEAGVNLPLRIGLENMPRHLDREINYITMYEPLTNMKKIVEQPSLKEAITRKYGRPYYDQFAPFIKAMAHAEGGNIPPGLDGWNKMWRHMKTGSTLYLLGAKLGTSLNQLTGFVQATEMAGVKNVGKALLHVLNNPSEFGKNGVQARSQEVKSAGHMVDSAFPEKLMAHSLAEWESKLTTRLSEQTKLLMRHYALWFIKTTQQISSTISYTAGEFRAEEILSKRMETDRSLVPDSPEWNAQKRFMADEVVRLADSANGLKDLPQFFRDNSWAWGFYNLVASYTNMIFGHTVNQRYMFKRGDYSGMIKSMTANHILPAIISAWIGRALWPKGDEEKDLTDPKQLKWAGINSLRATLQQYTSGVPFGGPVLNFMASEVVQQNPAFKDKLRVFGGTPNTLPIVDVLGRTAKATDKMIRKGKAATWSRDIEPVFWGTGDIVQQFTPIPFHGISQGVKFVERWMNGQIRANDAEFWKELASPAQPPKRVLEKGKH